MPADALPAALVTRFKVVVVCAFLLMATTINYADRLTLNQLSTELMRDLKFDKKQYGQAEAAFGVCFGVGAIVWGLVVDKFGPMRIYPMGVILWSLAGFATAYVRDFYGLLFCRGLLGFFESINWACGLVITSRLLQPKDRTLGNGMFQSGTALGSIITPFLVLRLSQWYGWPVAFQVVGVLGFVWSLAWILVLGKTPFSATPAAAEATRADGLTLGRFLAWLVSQPKFWVMAVMVVAVNMNWHFFRAWLPLYLREARGMSAEMQATASTVFYIAADVGAIGGGFVIQRLSPLLGVFRARVTTYFFFCLATLCSFPMAFIESSWVLWPCLVLVGMGSLGIFPIYFSLSQDFTAKRQGIVTGIFGSWNWAVVSSMQLGMGVLIQSNQDRTVARLTAEGLDQAQAFSQAIHDAYPLQIALSGLIPMLALAAMVILWPRKEEPEIGRQSNSQVQDLQTEKASGGRESAGSKDLS